MGIVSFKSMCNSDELSSDASNYSSYEIVTDKNSISDLWWKTSCNNKSTYLVSLKNGSRVLLKRGNENNLLYSFSPLGEYLIYFDIDEQACYSYNLENSPKD